MESNKIYIAFFLILFIGCKNQLDVDYVSLLEESSLSIDDEQFILVVPQNGCSTCVKKSYNFILRNFEKVNIKYIFTHYSSTKAIKVRFKVLGKDDTSNISFIDLSIALEHGLSQMYPSLLEVDKNGKAKVTFMNAEDGSDWEWLEKQVE